MQLKSQVASLYIVTEDHKEKLQQANSLSHKLLEDQTALEDGLNRLRIKSASTESKQAALAEEFSLQLSSEHRLTRADLKELFELSEAIKGTSKVILRENEVVRKDFECTKNVLSSELQRLRTENELLLRENERIYERARDIESLFNKVNVEYQRVAKNQRAAESVPRLAFKPHSERPTPKEMPLALPSQGLHTTMVNYRRNVQAKRLKNVYRLSSMSEAMNNSRTERFEAVEEVEYGNRLDRVKHEGVALNRLKMAFE
eukprot:TRINITY_DN5534_c0_g1_i8.p1 TRINITY_DN5534_c0_g1~~TRINITY_DN5534_c0_g1_i8.p1  ORF type:complete len:259 (+),score=74.67 TRINITY_DN5534_c0_g1_i8:144-920(+)